MKNKVCICQFLGTKYFLKIKLDEDKKNYVYFMDGDFTIRIDLRGYEIDKVVKEKDEDFYKALLERDFRYELCCGFSEEVVRENFEFGRRFLSDKVFTKKQKKKSRVKSSTLIGI